MGFEDDGIIAGMAIGMAFVGGLLVGKSETPTPTPDPPPTKDKEPKNCKELFGFVKSKLDKTNPSTPLLYNVFNPHSKEDHCPAKNIKEFMEQYAIVANNKRNLSIKYNFNDNLYTIYRPSESYVKETRNKYSTNGNQVKIDESYYVGGDYKFKRYFEVYTWQNDDGSKYH